MKRITKKLTQSMYCYERTKTINKKLNNLIFVSTKDKITFAKKSLQLCMIKNKILPFFENLSAKKKIKPIFYSNNLHSFGALKQISRLCYGTAVAGKWLNGCLMRSKIAKLKRKKICFFKKRKIWKKRIGFVRKTFRMLIATNAVLCQSAIKEAKKNKCVSLGCINLGDKNVTDVTYFIIGPKNNVSFSEKFCLVVSYLIKWKRHMYKSIKKIQKKKFLKYKLYIKKMKRLVRRKKKFRTYIKKKKQRRKKKIAYLKKLMRLRSREKLKSFKKNLKTKKKISENKKKIAKKIRTKILISEGKIKLETRERKFFLSGKPLKCLSQKKYNRSFKPKL